MIRNRCESFHATKMFLFCFFFFLVTISADDICQKCHCMKSGDALTLTLDCSNQNMIKIVESWPSPYTNIKAIFTKNNFSSIDKLPSTNSSLEIVLAKCNIESLPLGLFSGTPDTKFVDLSHNLLKSEEVTFDKFQGPVENNKPQDLAIEDLNLAYNQIHSLNKNVFNFLPNLTRLNLEGNDFTVLDVHTQMALANVPSLTSLNLANNELTELIPSAIESLKNLIELDLSKNDLDFVPSDLKLVGQTLQTLILDQNPIIEMTSETFTGMVNLRLISANSLTQVKHIGPGTFAPSVKLKKLSFCNGSLQDIDSTAFGSDSAIEELYLSNNDLTKIPPDLLQWSNLDTFEIDNNPWTCSCDLYSMSSALSRAITRLENGPTCTDPSSGQPLQIYSLESDICEAKKVNKTVYRHISAPLIGLITILIVALFVAISLAQYRYRRFVRRHLNRDPYVPQVIYSPLVNARA